MPLRAKIEASERRNAERTLADQAREAAEAATEYTRAHPLTVIGGAVAIGLLVGLATRPGRRVATRAAGAVGAAASGAAASAASGVKGCGLTRPLATRHAGWRCSAGLGHETGRRSAGNRPHRAGQGRGSGRRDGKPPSAA